MKSKDFKLVKQSFKSTPYILHEVQLIYSSLPGDVPMVSKIKCSRDAYDIMVNCFEGKFGVILN